MAGGLFSFTQNIMQAHLTCDHIDYRKKSPLKLVFDHARRTGIEKGMHYLHLGGGRQGCPNDSLFHFKAGFSEKTAVFSGWQLIIDGLKYNELVDLFKIDRQSLTGHFPAYRARSVETIK